VAHSLGSYMTLSLLQRLRSKYNVVKIVLLFPVFERPMETHKGKKFIPRFRRFRSLLIRSGLVIEKLPRPLRKTIISITQKQYDKMDNSESMKKALKSLLTYNCVRNISQMLDDISKFGDNSQFSNIFMEYGSKMTLYYGATDDWTPLSYCQQLSESYPKLDVRIDSHGIQHAFVLESCATISSIVASLVECKQTDDEGHSTNLKKNEERTR